MRFAWLKENKVDYEAIRQAFMHPFALVRNVYNLVFWIFLLSFFTIIDYSTGFIVFTIMIGIRLVLNLYTNNMLDLTRNSSIAIHSVFHKVLKGKPDTNDGLVVSESLQGNLVQITVLAVGVGWSGALWQPRMQ